MTEMTIQVNPLVSPRIITIPEADGESIVIQSLVNQIRNWEDNQVNLTYPRLLSAAGKEVLDTETMVGITAKLENAKVKFADRISPTDCNIYGGNLVAIDASGQPMNPVQYAENVTVALAKSSSATMVQLADIQTILDRIGIPTSPSLADDLDVIEAVVAFIKQVEWGRWKIVDNLPTSAQMIFYDADNNPIRTFDLKDKNGNPTVTNVYERVPVT